MTGRIGQRLRRTRDDEGFTLIEFMVVLVVLGVLLVMSVPIISTVVQATSRVRVTYTNLDDQLWLSTNFQRLLRAAVAPGPSFDGATQITPVTPFKVTAVSPTSLTFFANTGTANGPEEISASCTQTTTHKTLCAPTATFTLTLTPAKSGSCPFSNDEPTKVCTYPAASARKLLLITHVTNGAQPMFTYAYGSTTVCSDSLPSGCSGTDSTTFNKAHCKKSSTLSAYEPFTTCPAGEIDDVSFDLEFDVKPTKTTKTKTTTHYGGLQAKTVSGTYVMSSSSVLFSPVVG